MNGTPKYPGVGAFKIHIYKIKEHFSKDPVHIYTKTDLHENLPCVSSFDDTVKKEYLSLFLFY